MSVKVADRFYSTNAKALQPVPMWFDRFPLLTELYLGSCHLNGAPIIGSSKAHAHIWTVGPTPGSICMHEDVFDREYPTVIFLHEYAHLMIGGADSEEPDPYHGPTWEGAFLMLAREYGYATDSLLSPQITFMRNNRPEYKVTL